MTLPHTHTHTQLTHETVPSAYHASPSDAVSIHLDVRSRASLGCHFGTFVGATQETLEAMVELRRACDEAGVPNLRGEGGEGEGGAENKAGEGGEEVGGGDRGVDGSAKGRMGTINLGETWVGPVVERPWTEQRERERAGAGASRAVTSLSAVVAAEKVAKVAMGRFRTW